MDGRRQSQERGGKTWKNNVRSYILSEGEAAV